MSTSGETKASIANKLSRGAFAATFFSGFAGRNRMREHTPKRYLKWITKTRSGSVLRFVAIATLMNAAFIFGASVTPKTIDQGRQGNPKDESGDGEQRKSFWQRTVGDPVAFLTLWIALFNGGLVYVTWRLVTSTDKLWDAGERQLELTRNSAESQLRAYIFPEHITAKNLTTSPSCQAVFKNCGKTPAYDIRLSTTTTIAKLGIAIEPDPPPAMPDKTNGHLGPGMSFHLIASPEPPTTPSDVSSLINGEQILYFYGVLEYTDAFGKRRYTKFCNTRGGVGASFGDGPMAVYEKWNDAT